MPPGPQFDRQFESRRFTLTLAVLLSLAAVIIAALAFHTWRAARAHRAASERVLGDYASFAAWSFASRIRSSTFLAINPIFGGADHVRPQIADVLRGLRHAADSIASCQCGVDLTPQFVFIADLASDSRHLQIRDSALTPDVARRRLAEIASQAGASISRGVSSREAGALPYRWAAGRSGADAWIAFYGIRFRSSSDRGVVVGFAIRGEDFSRAILAPAFRQGSLLPRSLVRGTPVDSLLSVSVSGHGTTYFESTGGFKPAYSTVEPLGAPDTVLIATVGVNARAAPTLIIGGVPPSPVRTVLPLVSLAFVLLGLAFILGRRREMKTLEVRARLSEARLASLRAQLQPHFLFNVLNSIVMLARNGESRAVVSALTGLSDMLRVLLRDSSRDEIRLRDEMLFLKQYIALERIRFGDRLTADVSEPVDLADALIPALILQPLVENAIRHGTSASERDLRVSVIARRHGEHLELCVTDDGDGLAPADDRRRTGIGLSNTRERLYQLYGSSASLSIANSTSGGVVAIISLPLRLQRTS